MRLYFRLKMACDKGKLYADLYKSFKCAFPGKKR
jgi:hypothetical protein